MVHIAAGAFHTICTTADGSVFTWGRGDVGQLGLGDDVSNVLVSTRVRGALQSKLVMQVAAGKTNSACATGDGLVCTRGEATLMDSGCTFCRSWYKRST